MADIDLALKELRNTLLSIKFFDVALASLIVIAAALVATTYFQLPWNYALLPWAIYFTVMFVRRVNVNSYHEVEDKVPQLREALTTAADTRKQEGILVHELQKEVLDKMRAIKTSYFLGLGSTTRQLLLIAGLAFIVIGLSAFNVNFGSTTDFIGNQAFINNALTAVGFLGVNETLTGKLAQGKQISGTKKFVNILNNDSLYADEVDVALGNAPLELQVMPEYSGSNLQDVREADQKKFREQQAGQVEASAQEACGQDCNVPKDQQEIVKTYFEKVGTP